MDVMTVEAALVDQTVAQTSVNPIAEMEDLQLLLVGGGIGDTQL